MPHIRLDYEVFHKFPSHERELLRVKMGDPLYIKFITAQIEFQQRVLGELDPESAKSPEEFFKTAKEQRMILQFWTDLLHCAEDWGKQIEGAPRE